MIKIQLKNKKNIIKQNGNKKLKHKNQMYKE